MAPSWLTLQQVESVGNTFIIQRALDAYREVEVETLPCWRPVTWGQADKYKEDKDGKESAQESTAFEAGPVEDQEQQKHAGTGSEASQAMVTLEEDDNGSAVKRRVFKGQPDADAEEVEDPNQYPQQEEWQEDVAAQYVGNAVRVEASARSKLECRGGE